MSLFIWYLLKLSISLAIIWLFYQLMLRRLTFYNLNRWYLLGYSLLCFVIPLINIGSLLEKESFQGSTVVQYIANARYARACELLRSTELPLKQVAYKAGFAAASSFATAFRAETGLSPSEYRARYRAG